MTSPVLTTIISLTVAVAFACCDTAFADAYQVEFSRERRDDDGALRRADVVAVLRPENNRIRLNRAGGDTGLYHGWAGFLTEIQAKDEAGDDVALIPEGPGVWRLARRVRGEITVTYAVSLQHDRFRNEPGDDELAYARPYGVMWTGRALFIEGAPSNDVTVEFATPEEWRVTTPWAATSQAAWSFRPNTTDDLLNSAFFAGTHVQSDVQIGPSKALLALGPPVASYGAVFEPLLASFFNAFSELFREPPNDNFLLIAADASFLGGGVLGRTISLSLSDDAADSVGALAGYVIAHEGFHLWNVQWGDGQTTPEGMDWLTEGAAEYYAFLTSLRLGMLDEGTFWRLVMERYAAYEAALASGKTPVSASATKNSSPESYALIYSGGMMALLAIDLEIRAATNGERSLDDVMRAIHHGQKNNGRPLTLSRVGGLIDQATGVNVRPLLNRSVRGGDLIDINAALIHIGLVADLPKAATEPGDAIHRLAEQTADQIARREALIKGE